MNFLRTAAILLCLAFLSTTVATAAEREEKVVYHVSDLTNQSGALYNVRNHLNASPKAKIVVVTLGSGIDLLLEGGKDKNGNPYEVLVQELAGRGVQFRVCNNSLMGRKIDPKNVIPEATVVPSGVAEISRLQSQEGYGYIRP
jgi:intracellular sulfur oxidation DsrE/DsrF family protein